MWNDGIITTILDSFDHNESGQGGALYNYNNGYIETLNADFSYNTTQEAGGALFVNGNISEITGAIYEGNQALAENGGPGSARGLSGAIYIYEQGHIGTIGRDAVFKNNYAAQSGGAISRYSSNGPYDLSNDEIYGTYIGNRATIYGGAIYVNYELRIIDGYFEQNVATGEYEGDTFDGNYVKAVGSAKGGAFYYDSDKDDYGTPYIKNSSFINNYAESTGGKGYGGAIFANRDIEITVDSGYTREFSGNYIKNSDGNIVSNAI